MVLQLGEGVCHEGFSEWGCVDICRVVAKWARVHGLASLVNEQEGKSARVALSVTGALRLRQDSIVA